MGVEIQNHGNKSFKFNGINISGCTFNMLPSPQYGFAISLSGFGRNAVVENNLIKGGVIGVELVDFSDVSILSNRIQDVSSKVIAASTNDKISNIEVRGNNINCVQAKIQMLKAKSVKFSNNEMKIGFVELGGCSRSTISNNVINSFGRYSVMIDGSGSEARYNTVADNVIMQNGDNWAVFRCYGNHSRNNKFLRNKVQRANTKGTLFDQQKGAAKNRLE